MLAARVARAVPSARKRRRRTPNTARFAANALSHQIALSLLPNSKLIPPRKVSRSEPAYSGHARVWTFSAAVTMVSAYIPATGHHGRENAPGMNHRERRRRTVERIPSTHGRLVSFHKPRTSMDVRRSTTSWTTGSKGASARGRTCTTWPSRSSCSPTGTVCSSRAPRTVKRPRLETFVVSPTSSMNSGITSAGVSEPGTITSAARSLPRIVRRT